MRRFHATISTSTPTATPVVSGENRVGMTGEHLDAADELPESSSDVLIPKKSFSCVLAITGRCRW
jgi:hypothetical protein